MFKYLLTIDVQDWDDLVEKTYGKPYSFQQQDGCKERGNYNVWVPREKPEEYLYVPFEDEINGDEMGVSFEAWLKRDPKEWNGKEGDERFLDLFWHRNFYPDVEHLAYDLYQKGLINHVEFTIVVDW